MATFINPFVDRGFKRLFGQEDSKELLIDLLNGLFEGERVITELSFLNVEMPAESTDSRAAVFDLKCKDKEGRIFIVEVQNAPQTYFYERGLYYLCRIISDQDRRGNDWKFELYPVYGIFLLNFKSGKTDKVRTDIVLADRETGKQMSDTMRQIYLEMPFFNKEEAECETSLDYWLYTLKYMEKLETLPFKGQKQLFEKLERLAKIVNMNKKERMEYEESLKIYRDNQGVLDYAIEKGYMEGIEKGLKEGIEKGMQKGLEYGMEKGLEKGLEKGMEKGIYLVAAKMKMQGIDFATITSVTGLNAETIATL